MKKKPVELLTLARKALEKAGAHPVMAEKTAAHLVRAEEQGLPTHGMSRVPFYCAMLRNDRADGNAHPVAKADHGATILIDNADALPYESCAWAIAEVIARARRNGIGQVVPEARNTEHGNSGLGSESKLLPELLHAATPRYECAAVGKWHLAGASESGVDRLHPLGKPAGRWFDMYAGSFFNLQDPEGRRDASRERGQRN